MWLLVKNNNSPEQSLQGHGRVPITGGFQDVTRQGARQSHLGFPSHEWLYQAVF